MMEIVEGYTLPDIVCEIDFTECESRGEENKCFGYYKSCNNYQQVKHNEWVDSQTD